MSATNISSLMNKKGIRISRIIYLYQEKLKERHINQHSSVKEKLKQSLDQLSICGLDWCKFYIKHHKPLKLATNIIMLNIFILCVSMHIVKGSGVFTTN